MTPRWLKLKDAVDYSSIGQHRLKLLAFQNKIVGFQDPGNKNSWIFDRWSLDRYRQKQAGELELKAKEIMK